MPRETLIKTVPVQYSPEDSTAALPAPPIANQDMTSNYYNVYNYSHLIGMIKVALENGILIIVC